MRDVHPLLMSTPAQASIGHPLLSMLPLEQSMTAGALHGKAAPKPVHLQRKMLWTQPSDGQWPLQATTQAPVMTVVHVSSKLDSAYTKWLGHRLVHVLLRIKAGRNPQWQAAEVPADFWLEDEEAYKVRNRGISGGMLMLLIANRQGVQEYLNPSQTGHLAGGVSHLGGVEFCDPHVHDFPVGDISARQTARFTPRFRLPKAFPDKKLGTHNQSQWQMNPPSIWQHEC